MTLAKSSVLIIDDEQSLRDFVNKNLEVRGFQTYTAANGLEGLALFKTNDVDLVIVDLMMPHMNGLETIRRIRQESLVPIIVLSALGEVDDRVAGLRAGGDDYLVKPYAFSELLARLEALTRRMLPQMDEFRLSMADLSMDTRTHEVRRDGQKIHLQPMEFRLLEFLLRKPNQVFTRTMLLERVWGYHFNPQTNIIDVHISRLRRKIDTDSALPLLHTVRGTGYKLSESP